MKEAVFQGEWRKSFLHFYGGRCHFIKIPDQPRFGGERTFFAATRPYDCFCLVDGVFLAFELKQQRALAALPFSAIKPHQVVNLTEVVKAGGMAYIVINLRVQEPSEKVATKHGFPLERVNVAHVIPLQSLALLRKFYCSRESLPLSFFSGEDNIYRDSGCFRVLGRRDKILGYIWDVANIPKRHSYV